MPVKKKGKAKKKKEDTKKAVSQSPLRHGSAATCSPEEVLILFLHRVIQWLQGNYARAIDLFRRFASNGGNELSKEDFAIGMRLLEAPVTRSEIEELVKIIDVDRNGTVNIVEFDKIIRKHLHTLQSRGQSCGSDEETAPKSVVSLLLSPSRLSEKCPNCDIGLAEPPPDRNGRFVKLKIILAPFKGFPPHPGHFEVDVTDSTTIHGLKMKIRTHLDDSADGIALFKEPSCSKASYLAPSLSLEECGIVGGPKLEPVNGEVFYDYMPVINDCPVLMTDSHIPDVPIFENGYTRNPYPNIKKHVMVPD